MRYVIQEGRHKVVQAYHFGLLNHFKFSNIDKKNFPFFISNSLEISIRKFKTNIVEVRLHEFMIKLVYNKSLANQPRRNPRVIIKVGGEIITSNESYRPKVMIIEE